MVFLRFRIRRVGGRYIGECLEAGLHVEAATREEARDLLDDAYRAWDKGIALLENAGRPWEFSRVPLYPLRRLLFDISYLVMRARMALGASFDAADDGAALPSYGLWVVPRAA